MKELEPYKEHIDLELTTKIKEQEISKWLPFIGKNYQRAPEKVLIVGLSHYLIGDNPNWERTLKSTTPNIVSTFENGMCYDYSKNDFTAKNTSKLHRGLERIFFNVSQNELYSSDFSNCRTKLWNAISYYQFIETPMIGNTKHDKGLEKEEIRNGEAIKKLVDLIKILKPDHVVMLSNSYAYHGELAKTAEIIENEEKRIYETPVPKRTDIRTCYFTMNGQYNFTFSAVVHPSRYKYVDFQHSLLKRTMPKFLEYI